MKFSKKDIAQIQNKGLSLKVIEDQIAIFKRGNKPVKILAAATLGNGIKQVSKNQADKFVGIFEDLKHNLKLLNFIPASGAATRMFKELYIFVENFNPENDSLQEYFSRNESKKLKRFLDELPKLPFYEETLTSAINNFPDFNNVSIDNQKYYLVRSMLLEPGLELGNFPKGLVPFHKYKEHTATAFEEHLYEAGTYAEKNNKANLHFTVSKEHLDKFQNEYNEIRTRVEEQTGTFFQIGFSFQDPKTDTIAVDPSNEVFRTSSEELFFRPGGHGALIENLNNLDADVVFIKNIDNLVTASNREEVAFHKKMLAGNLLKIQQECFYYLEILNARNFTEISLQQIIQFSEDQLRLSVSSNFESLSEEEQIQKLILLLNRPLRVCGMVKNEGEPGGGPFLVEFSNGESSLQIIEGAQIETNDPQQNEIAQNATHFNPVDLVCGLRNYKGEKFDLNEFVDPEMSFITTKTKDGKELKALELPGLWNGAMAKWNTIFVEVPVSTFNPVKTVADLLKPSHQA
ncbi:uncharacterized protein DUF4301 [Gillisia mitskevichiae]|uniref:Uncharacterized protein DUF4301 n=1 Tax=Gillisia mitskevichiae TaxID=270921 RepID=A0A495PY63_9FLAO|nr:DUF4301 family protein [Gillisia mitskevichiae]RKS55179.1 uncharacterized protein DUF4301 [Gillisia mitskevichiae]